MFPRYWRPPTQLSFSTRRGISRGCVASGAPFTIPNLGRYHDLVAIAHLPLGFVHTSQRDPVII
jgi:hypothetical protein